MRWGWLELNPRRPSQNVIGPRFRLNHSAKGAVKTDDILTISSPGLVQDLAKSNTGFTLLMTKFHHRCRLQVPRPPRRDTHHDDVSQASFIKQHMAEQRRHISCVGDGGNRTHAVQLIM